MQEFHFSQAPFKVYGAPLFYRTGKMWRLPDELTNQLPKEFIDWNLAHRCPGARLCFRTDSPVVSIRILFRSISVDIGMSLYAAQSGNVFVGERQKAVYKGLVMPRDGYNRPEASGTFHKSSEMEDVTVYLPRNEEITDVFIQLEDGATVETPTPYTHAVPILFYGSSITEGGCCSMPATAYNALVCRWLDADYINMGFSGSAKGEIIMADYLNSLEKSVFVMDYDHNAPNAAHLRETHAPFFRRIRQHSPHLPVIFMTKPNFDYDQDSRERRQIIFDTYQAALDAGDNNVYFLDGETFFGEEDRFACSNDCLHPNDLGMYRMAKKLYPVLAGILNP